MSRLTIKRKHSEREDRDPSGKREDLADLEEEGVTDEAADQANYRASNYDRFFDFDGTQTAFISAYK